MARIITPQDFEHERLISRSPRQYSEVLPGLRVIHSGGTVLNPDILQTPEISWLTGRSAGLMVHEATLRPDDDSYTLALVKQPEIQRKMYMPSIIQREIDGRGLFKRKDVREAFESLRKIGAFQNPIWDNPGRTKYIEYFCSTNAVKTALENSASALDLSVADFHELR